MQDNPQSRLPQNDVRNAVVGKIRAISDPGGTVRGSTLAVSEAAGLARGSAVAAVRPLLGRQGISGFWLKLAAIVAMTCNHAGYMFFGHLAFVPRCVLISVGGLTFPIMAFLLVEGYRHTMNLKRYAVRLAVFACIAEIPFWLFLEHRGNVLFTLLAGLAVLWVDDHLEGSPARIASLLVLFLSTWFCDWGVIGPGVVLLMSRSGNTRAGRAIPILFSIAIGAWETVPNLIDGLAEVGSIAQLPFVLYYLAGNTAAIPLLWAYNGQRGTHPMKWFFYAYYPAHIAVLGIIHVVVFGSSPPLLLG